jgi:hypothetical protein
MTFEQEDIESGRLAMVGIFTVSLIFVAIIGLQVLYHRFQKMDGILKDTGRPRALAAMQTEHLTQINSYRWVDRSTKTVTIPIKRAKQLELERLSGVRQ